MNVSLLERTHDEIIERIAPDLVRPLDEVKREHIERALILCRGNISLAAEKLQVSRSLVTKLSQKWRKEQA